MADGLALVDLIDSRDVHRPQDRYPGPGWGYVDHVAGDQGGIPAGVTLGEEGVHVHRGDGLAAAAQLDGAQATVAVGAAGLEERVDQSREAADHVLAWPDCLTDDKHLDAAQSAHGHGHGEVAVHAADVGSQHPLSVPQGYTGQGHRADLGQEYPTVAVDHKVVGDLDQAVDLHGQLVTRAEHVAGRDRRCLGRIEPPRVGEQLVAEKAQVLPSCTKHEALELGLLQLLSLRGFGLDLAGEGLGSAQLGGRRLAP